MEDLRFLQGQVAERRRVSSILLAPIANGREREAIELALNTTLSAAAALATLADLPKRPADVASRKQITCPASLSASHEHPLFEGIDR